MDTLEKLAKEIIASIEEEDENINMRKYGYRKSGKAQEFKTKM
jgi:hypothetical protein